MVRSLFRLCVAGCLLFLLSALPSTPAHAAPPDAALTGEVDSLCDQARSALERGEGQKAIELLQQAIARIQESSVRGLATFLPRAPEGWTREEPETASGTWGAGGQSFQWSNVTCRYTRESDGATANITLTNQPQLLQGQQAMAKMLENPMMAQAMNQDPRKKIELLKEEGWTAWRVVEAAGDAQIVALSGSVMLMIDLSPGDAALLDSFWKGTERKGLAKAAAVK